MLAGRREQSGEFVGSRWTPALATGGPRESCSSFPTSGGDLEQIVETGVAELHAVGHAGGDGAVARFLDANFMVQTSVVTPFCSVKSSETMQIAHWTVYRRRRRPIVIERFPPG
jgi:hypothetical protein